MTDTPRPQIPREDYGKPIPKGGDLPPLELLPEREWLFAKILKVEYRVVVFNNKVQNLTRKDEDTGQDIEIIDEESGLPIPRREFNITFQMHDYYLPNQDPRKTWLQIGASLGEKAHLPTLLYNTIGAEAVVDTPEVLISGLEGMEVRLQLKNKPNKKDASKPPYQQVVYDAVQSVDKQMAQTATSPMSETDTNPEPEKREPQYDENGNEIAWDE